ncbi:MAG: heme a synthase [Acidimicrobiaceae bacterium]|jgi:cytochrome c oxidase assembly protein subunit 15|nr:heme a synthase [Acidimicrobiaceae bacterium]
MSPRTYRRITLVALVALAFIVVTGGAVRLTGSGLGCPHWPNCDSSLVRVGPNDIHKSIESVNRTITGIVSVAVIAAVLGSLIRRPRRRDLVWLSIGLVGGVIGQIVLGGLVVLFDLYPPLVMGHFVLSMLLLADATVLHHRAGREDDAVLPAAPPDVRGMGLLLVAGAAVVILLGTVVTASGPHPGSNGAQIVERLPFSLHRVAQLHGTAVMLFLAMAVFAAWSLARGGAPPAVVRRAEALLVVLVAQAAVGYAQYFSGVPVLLVAFHIAGATAVWIATLRLQLALSTMAPVRAVERALVAA